MHTSIRKLAGGVVIRIKELHPFSQVSIIDSFHLYYASLTTISSCKVHPLVTILSLTNSSNLSIRADPSLNRGQSETTGEPN